MVKQYMAVYNEPSDDDMSGKPTQESSDRPPANAAAAAAAAAEASGWRSPEDVPAHIPPFFPPLPGLERPFMALPPQPSALAPTPANAEAQPSTGATAPSAGGQNDKEEAPRVSNAGALNMAISAGADLASHQHKHGHVDPWKHVVPFDRSHLVLREPQLLPSNIPVPSKSGEPAALGEEDQQLQPPLSSLMSYFKLHKRLANEPPLQPTWSSRSKRRQAAALLQRPDAAISDHFDLSDLNSSIGGLIGAQRPRFTKKTPGWLPYPRHRPKDARDKKASTPTPILHAYDLQSDMVDSISEPLVKSRQRDLSSELMTLVGGSNARRVAGKDIGLPPGVQGFMRRTTRIAQPGPLGSGGETLPYTIAEADPSTGDHTKRMLFGFDWKESDFAAPLLPGAPGGDAADKAKEGADAPEAGPSGTQNGGGSPSVENTTTTVQQGQSQRNGSVSPGHQAQQHTTSIESTINPVPATSALTSSLKVTLNGTGATGSSPEPAVANGVDSAQALQPQSITPAIDVEVVPSLTATQSAESDLRKSAPPASHQANDGGEPQYDWVNGRQFQDRASAPPDPSTEKVKTAEQQQQQQQESLPHSETHLIGEREDVDMLPVIGSAEALGTSSSAAPSTSSQPVLDQEMVVEATAVMPAPVPSTTTASSPSRLSLKISEPVAVADSVALAPEVVAAPASTTTTTRVSPGVSGPSENQKEGTSRDVSPHGGQERPQQSEPQDERVLVPTTASQQPLPTSSSQEDRPASASPLKLSLKLGGGGAGPKPVSQPATPLLQ